MKKTLALLLSILMLASMCACGAQTDAPAADAPAEGEPAAAAQPAEGEPAAADGEVYTIVVALTKPEIAASAFIDYLHAVEEASGGRIVMDIYPGGSLLKVSEIPNALATGIADLAEINVTEFPSILPLNSTIPTMPFAGLGDNVTSIYSQLLDEFDEMNAEYENAGMHLLGYFFGPGIGLHLTSDKANVTVPQDLKGMKIVCTNASMSSFIQDMGGAPVACDPGDMYSNLDKGVADGVVTHYGMLFNNALFEVTDQTLVFYPGVNAGIWRDLNVYTFSSATWNRLPADLQQIFIDLLPQQADGDAAKMVKNYDNAMGAITEKGSALVELTEEQASAWSDAFAPIREQMLGELDEKGLPATTIYERMEELAAG